MRKFVKVNGRLCRCNLVCALCGKPLERAGKFVVCSDLNMSHQAFITPEMVDDAIKSQKGQKVVKV